MSQSYMPELAPLVVLAFLGFAGLLLAAAVGACGALVFRRTRLAKWLAGGGLAVAAAYSGVLLAFSFSSEERVLNPGDRKYFCEIDCHLAYSVEGTTATAGPTETRYAVSVKTWFDPNTIASFRGNAPLTPNPRAAFLVDEAGRRFPASSASLAPLSRALSPGESYVTTLDFDVPNGVRRLRLLLGVPPGVENALIGHENGPFHGKIYFALGPKAR